MSTITRRVLTGVKHRSLWGQQQSPTLLKNGFSCQGSVYSGKVQKMNLRYGNVFIINRYSSHYTKLSPSEKIPNLYDVLGVSPNANASEIKSAFYNLSKSYHPDINRTQEAATKFAEILSAYEILGNQTKRRMYDRGTMMHPRFGVSPHRDDEKDDRRKRPTRPGKVGQRPEGAGPSRDFTDASGRPAFKFAADFHDYYTTSRDNRVFHDKQSEYYMKQHLEDEKSRRFRGIFSGIFVFTFVGLIFLLTNKFDHRQEEKKRTSFSYNRKK